MRRYGLVGYPLTHSFSKGYFDEKFKNLGLDSVYYSLYSLASVENLCDLAAAQSLNGFNVTIPYKQAVISYMDDMSPEAKAIGAVNCVKVDGSRWTGYNTDYNAFKQSLESFLPGRLVDRALVLGTGGSSKAVQYALHQIGIKFSVVSRSGELNYGNLEASHIHEAQLIVNTTPLGMYPGVESCPEIPFMAVTAQHFAFDLVYNPAETLFLQHCRQQGAKTKNGLEMLHLQADLSWEIWNS